MKLIKFYAQCISLFSLFLLFSCEDDIENGSNLFSTTVIAHLTNDKGDNLLANKGVEGYIDANQIRVYDIIDGKEVIHYYKNNDEDFYGFYFIPDSFYYFNAPSLLLELGQAKNSNDGKYENLIRWDERRSDKVNIERKGRFIRKIWINNKLVYQSKDPNVSAEITFVIR